MIRRILCGVQCCFGIHLLLCGKKQGPEALLWFLILCFLPGLGLLLYFFFGADFPARWDHSRGIKPPALQETHQNDVRLVVGWQETLPALLSDCAEARESIDISFYGFAADERGEEFLSALCEAAGRGVRVRLLYDAFGSLRTPASFFHPLQACGGQVQRCRPWPTHYRYHRKMVVVDQRVTWAGSMNIGKKYTDGHPVKTPWQDVQVRVEGDAAREMARLFAYDWRCATGEETREAQPTAVKASSGTVTVRVLYSGITAQPTEIHDAWLDQITAAQHDLLIQTPYLIPDETLLAALESALRRGVRVRVMIPGISSGPHLQPLTDENAAALTACGAEIYSFPGYLHAKTLCRDGAITLISSVNLDERSMFIDEENAVWIADADFAHHFVERFEGDAERCTRFHADDFRAPLQARLLRIIAPVV